jgi:thioredoxin-dependent peroxiredoxin
MEESPMLTRSFGWLCFALLTLSACAAPKPVIPVDTRSVQPGTAVTRGGSTSMDLLGTPIKVGDPVPAVGLYDTNLKQRTLAEFKGEVLLVSIVPSLDTQVCEQQTHLLGEAGGQLSPQVRRITISRDLPFAQKRFADETGFKEMLYLSDYRNADFARASGLLVDPIFLLARSVLVVDRQGVVRYLQVVPELSHLPDLQTAIAKAQALVKE